MGFFWRRAERIEPAFRTIRIVTGPPDEAAPARQVRDLELDEYHHTLRMMLRRRLQALTGIAIVAGALLGFLAVVIDSMTRRAWGPPDPAADVLAIIVGAFFGCLSAIVVPAALRRKDLRIALPLIYLPATAATIACAWRFDPLLASAPAMSLAVALSALLWICQPDALQSIRRERCHRCGYNLEGNATGRCPECGLDWSNYTDSDRAPVSGRFLGAVPLSRLLWRARAGRVIVISSLILILSAAIARHTGPRFTYARFESIEHGMSREEVLEILGRADRIESPQPRVQRWIYEPGGWGADRYIVRFADDRVISTRAVVSW